MTEAQLDRYAKLILWCLDGVNGQAVRIRSEVAHHDFMLRIADEAYRQGARLVDLDFIDPLLARSRVRHAPEGSLGLFPDYTTSQQREYARADWSNISIAGSEYPDALDDLDESRVGIYSRANRMLRRPVLDAMIRSLKPWIVALMPTAAISAKAFPQDSPRVALDKYEKAMVNVLCLDEPEPSRIWERRFAEITDRSDRYNELQIDELHVRGPGTDLELGLLPGSRWSVARERTPGGRQVIVNIPSFEVYASPDFRRTNGKVAVTRPFESTSAPGQLINGAWFEFRDGGVVDFGADSGVSTLRNVIEMDEQARFLGEIALVDQSSPVAAAGVNFHEVLFDENAASHIALGAGFPSTVEGCAGLPDAELLAAGVNVSMVHDDMMIGSAAIDVDARTRGGRRVAIMRQGEFVY